MLYKSLRILLIAAITSASALFGFTGCESKENEIRIGSTYNTYKVMQNDFDFVDLGARIDVRMAKGETEGAQLILTPQRDVKKYRLVTENLEDGKGNVLPVSAVEVFVQKYIEVTAKTKGQENEKYPAGYYPDMLLPIDIANEYGETQIQGGNNQGITVEITTTSETVAGNYTGDFTLVVDGQSFNVPVSVTVWDIDITKCYGMNSFNGESGWLMSGELSNTPETYTGYYETLLNKYKVCYTDLPGSSDPEEMAKNVIKYWDNPNFTSFCIPSVSFSGKTIDSGSFKPYLTALALNSTPERILFDKAYVYPEFLDEVTDSEGFNGVERTNEIIYGLQEEVFAELQSDGYFDEYPTSYKEEFYKSLTEIPVIITSVRRDIPKQLREKANTYCVVIDQIDNQVSREELNSYREQNKAHGGELWYYTCVQPLYPYPSHHIDDYLIGSRIMRWMEKAYDMQGYLYWSLHFYFHSGSAAGVQYADPYKTAVRFGGFSSSVNGDGFMLYPGRYYGQETPFGSIRLTTYRDSQEDLNLLYAFDNLLREKETFYGVERETFSMNEFMADIYDDIFTETVYNPDDAVFYGAREKLVELIGNAEKEENFVYKNTVSDTSVTTEFYLNDGYELKVNGQKLTAAEQAGLGFKYTLTSSLSNDVSYDAEIMKNGETVSEYKIFGAKNRSYLSLNAEEGNMTASEGSSFVQEGESVKVTFVAKGETLSERLRFRPSFTVGGFGTTFDKIDGITVRLTNPTEKDLSVRFRAMSGNTGHIVRDEVFVPAGETVTVHLNGISGLPFANLSTADKLEISVANIDDRQELFPDRELIINDIIFGRSA